MTEFVDKFNGTTDECPEHENRQIKNQKPIINEKQYFIKTKRPTRINLWVCCCYF